MNQGSNHASHGAAAYDGNAQYVGGDVHGNLVGVDKKELHFHIEAGRTELQEKDIKQLCEISNRNVKQISWQKFKDLMKVLCETAKKKSKLEDTTDTTNSVYTPLQMAQYEQKHNPDEHGHLHTREEIIDSYNNSSLDYLQPKDFFKKAKEVIRNSPEYKRAISEEAKLESLNEFANVIGVIGQAGVGKSTLTKILLSQIVSKKKLYNVDYIFYARLRDFYNKTEMNLFQFLMGEEVCSSLDWMNDEEIRNKVLKLLVESESVCILLDGLDEVGITKQDLEKFNVKIDGQYHPQNFILGLLSGKIFPEAKKIVTSRPGKMLCLSDEFRPKFLVQILGINTKGIKTLCKNLCNDKSSQVLDKVENQPDLYSYMTIPIHCVLVINCIYEILTNRVDEALPNSITDVFILSYFNFAKTEHMRKSLSQFDIKNLSDLKNICSLAWSGIKDRQFYFSDKELKKIGLNQNNISSFTVTVVPRNQKWSKTSFIHRATSNCTYFTHLLIQEFFAAIYCLFLMNEEIFRETFSSVPGPSGGILSNHYLMVVKFMFGLSNAETFKMFQSIYPKIVEPTKHQNLSRQYASESMSNISTFGLNKRQNFICSLAYELRNDLFAQKIAELLPYKVGRVNDLLPAEIVPFFFVLKHRKKSLQLFMRGENFGNAIVLLIKEMKSLLQQSNHIQFDVFLIFPSEFENIVRDELMSLKRNKHIYLSIDKSFFKLKTLN